MHQQTCPHSLQQNVRVEIKHKHLLQITRAILFQAPLPRYFWAEALLRITCIINRLPTPVFNWLS